MKKIVSICCALFWLLSIAMAQDPQASFELKSQLTSSKTYVARDFIKLMPGFSFKPTAGQKFNAKIDQALLFPPTDATYMKPDGTITTDPTQGGVVGSIPGQFAVSPSGAATYSIPIDCPAGINGMQPNISLNYNSQAGNGIAGWGWNIGGLSMISRVPKNQYFDGETSGILFDNTSPIALDGQRLIKISETTEVAEYRTENDNYSKIVAHKIGNKDFEYFEVQTKAGLTLRYEGVFLVNQTRTEKNFVTEIYLSNRWIQSSSRQISQSKDATHKNWVIKQISDANGNYMTFDYSFTNEETKVQETKSSYTYSDLPREQPISPQLIDPIEDPNPDPMERTYTSTITYSINSTNERITKIRYGGNANAGTEYFAEVKFSYVDRGAASSKYIGGDEQKVTIKLDKVEAISGGKALKSYELNYSTDISLKLDNIKLISTEGTSLIPTKFMYGNKIPNLNNYIIDGYVKNPDATPAAFGTHDFTGDGNQEYYYIDFFAPISTNGTVKYQVYLNIIDRVNQKQIAKFKLGEHGQYAAIPYCDLETSSFGDFFKTGYTSVVGVHRREGYLSSNWFTVDFHNLVDEPIQIHIDDCSSLPFVASGNFDGLFGDELLLIKPNYKSISGGYEYTAVMITDPSKGLKTTFKIKTKSKIRSVVPGDFYGNQRTDLLLALENGYSLYRNIYGSGQFFSSVLDDSNITHPNFCSYKNPFTLGNLNNDQYPDLVYRRDDDQTWCSAINRGDGTFSTTILSNISGKKNSSSDNEKDEAYIVDINNDGLNDIVIGDEYVVGSTYTHTFWKYYYLTDNGYVNKKEGLNGYRALKGHNGFGDYNNDGVVDWIRYNNEEEKVYVLKNGIGLNQNLLTNVSNGYGVTTTIDYSRLVPGDKGIYSISSTNDDYSHIVKSSYYPLVSSYTEGEQSYSLAYEDCIYSKKRNSLLGFLKTSLKNETTGIETESVQSLNTDYSIIIPDKTTVKNGSSIASVKSQKFLLEDKGSKRYVTKLHSQKEEDRLKGITKLVTYNEYDDYLNPKKITTEFVGSTVKEIQSTNYVTRGSWCPNKPSRITLTKYKGAESEPRIVDYLYDANGNLTKETKDVGDKNAVETEYLLINDFGNAKTVKVAVNGKSRSTTYVYSTDGRFLKEKTNGQTGFTTKYNYNETTGFLNSEESVHLNLKTAYQYDGFGRLIKTTYPDGTYTVNALQWRNSDGPANAKYYSYTETTGESPQWTWYDKLGREIRKDYFGFDTSKKIGIETTYDSKGRLFTTSRPFYIGGASVVENRYTYDSFGRVKMQISPMGRTDYDYSTTRQTKVTTPSGSKTEVINSAGQLTESIVNDRKVTYTYWPSGLVRTSTPENGVAVETFFDAQGNRVKLIDPNAGTIDSEYNGFGELVWEEHVTTKVDGTTDAIRTSYNYDDAGRLYTITAGGEITTNDYDTGTGFLSSVVKVAQDASRNHEIHYKYDEGSNKKLGRITTYTEKIGDRTFTSKSEYDYFGREVKHTYPSGYYTTNSYNKYGHLTEVKSEGSVSVWKAERANVRGQLTHIKKGAKITSYGFEESRAFPKTIFCPGIIQLSYSFDSKGNLEYREDLLTNQREKFNYRTDNQLDDWEVLKNGTSVALFDIDYDEHGNITTKSDIGYTMAYGESSILNGKTYDAGPHALTSIKGKPSLIADKEQSITYNDFEKVETIAEGNDSLLIIYGLDKQRRIGEYYTNKDLTKTRYYLGEYEEDVFANGADKKVHYISGANGLAAIYIESNGSGQLYYAYTDYLGSLTTLTDEAGTPVEQHAFDPWGNRRDVDNWQTLITTPVSYLTDRGFTMHEHLDGFALINMNGRVYDPLISRFLSPDPQLQAPGNWLNYNRYAYCLNNPLIYTDPSGEIWDIIFPALTRWLTGVADNMINNDMSFVQAVSYSSYVFDGYYSPSDNSYGNAQWDAYLAEKNISNIASELDAWTANGVQYRRLSENTLAFTKFDNANPTWEYGFIVPQNYGSWGEVGSDGLIHIGCMACHAPNGAYNLAAYNSRESMNGSLIGYSIVYATTLAQGAYANSVRASINAAKSSTNMARTLGVQGERAVGTLGSKTRIPSLTGTAKYRIPDGLSRTTLTEVKNVKSLSLTRQLKDFHLYSTQRGLQFNLYTRPNTTFSAPLQNLINQGSINVYTIPGL